MFLINMRKSYFSRRLLSQEFVVNVGDNLGQTGQVAYTAHCSAIKDEAEITFTVAAVVDVIFISNAEGGGRQISLESFVFAIDG